MKKFICAALACVMAFSMAACSSGGSETTDAGNKVVKIGVYEPASGDNGAGGKQEVFSGTDGNARSFMPEGIQRVIKN